MYYGFEVLWIREAWPVITQTAQRKQERERVGDVPDKRHQEGQRLCLHPAVPSTSLSASCHHSIIVQMNVTPHVRVTSSSCWSLVCNTDHALWTDLGTRTFTFLPIIGTFFFFFYTKTACWMVPCSAFRHLLPIWKHVIIINSTLSPHSFRLSLVAISIPGMQFSSKT